jgi:hypothetical protein
MAVMGSPAGVACPVCGTVRPGYSALAAHLTELAGHSDSAHVMWLNRRVTKHRRSSDALAPILRRVLEEGRGSHEERVGS